MAETPVSSQPPPPVDAAEQPLSVAEPSGPPLQAALKPFGKGGVRLGWKADTSLIERGDTTWIEVLPHGSFNWQFHSELRTGGRSSGVQIIKTMGLGAGEPKAHAWRLRSSGGETSEDVSLGGGGGGGGSALKRGATAIFRGVGAALAPVSSRATEKRGELPTGGPSSSGGGAASSSSSSVASRGGTSSCSASSSSSSSSSSKVQKRGSTPKPPPPSEDIDTLWQQVAQREAEIEMMLRVALDDSAAVKQARERVTKALAFDDALTRHAATAERSKGNLFQALLEALRDQGAEHAQMDNSSKNLFAGSMVAATTYKMSLADWARLTYDASDLRTLVRVKVADDNDLRTARLGLELAAEFFEQLSKLAALKGEDEGLLLQSLRMSA